jgi:hypothetical protein
MLKYYGQNLDRNLVKIIDKWGSNNKNNIYHNIAEMPEILYSAVNAAEMKNETSSEASAKTSSEASAKTSSEASAKTSSETSREFIKWPYSWTISLNNKKRAALMSYAWSINKKLPNYNERAHVIIIDPISISIVNILCEIFPATTFDIFGQYDKSVFIPGACRIVAPKIDEKIAQQYKEIKEECVLIMLSETTNTEILEYMKIVDPDYFGCWLHTSVDKFQKGDVYFMPWTASHDDSEFSSSLWLSVENCSEIVMENYELKNAAYIHNVIFREWCLFSCEGHEELVEKGLADFCYDCALEHNIWNGLVKKSENTITISKCFSEANRLFDLCRCPHNIYKDVAPRNKRRALEVYILELKDLSVVKNLSTVQAKMAGTLVGPRTLSGPKTSVGPKTLPALSEARGALTVASKTPTRRITKRATNMNK